MFSRCCPESAYAYNHHVDFGEMEFQVTSLINNSKSLVLFETVVLDPGPIRDSYLIT